MISGVPADQVLGGSGYTRDYPVERLYRDNRLNAIHEGTNGIQAIDLLGRKVLAKGGGLALLQWIQSVMGKASGPVSTELAAQLGDALERVSTVTMALAQTARRGSSVASPGRRSMYR